MDPRELSKWLLDRSPSSTVERRRAILGNTLKYLQAFGVVSLEVCGTAGEKVFLHRGLSRSHEVETSN